MPSAAHEVMIAALKEHPEWLDALLEALGHGPLVGGMTVADTALRLVDPVEVRPDLVLASEGKTGPWAMVEIQRGRDDVKERRWLVAVALLVNERQSMGDVVIITHERHVAAWAARAVEMRTALGTRLVLEPVVIQLTGDRAETLLATGKPELAFFAAWCVHDRHGERAQAIVERALESAVSAPDEQLRAVLVRSIFNVLSEPLVALIREVWMDPQSVPESPAFRALREEVEARGEARGEARALVRVLESRGFHVDAETRARIEACSDVDVLERWIVRAVTAGDVAAVFAA